MSVTRKKHIDLSRYVQRVTAATVQEAASKVEAQAAELAPVGQIGGGGLRDSIQSKKIDDYTWEVGPTVDYGIYVEFGTGDQGSGGGKTWVYFSEALQQFVTTSGMAAQPYLRPALDAIRKRVDRIWRVESGRFVRR